MERALGKLKLRLLFNGRLVEEAVFDLQKILVGRDPACDLVIDNPLVSGRHARISRTDEGYVIEDLGSTNGTRLGGRTVQREILRTGAVATIGKHQLELTEEGESDDPADPGKATIAPRTEATIVARPFETEEMHVQRSYQAFLDAGGRPAELRLIRGKGTPLTFRLRKEISMVGKDQASDVRLSGMLLPATAFFVERSRGGYQVSPSARKVLVNGAPIEGRVGLVDGDEISVGSATLRFQVVG